MARIRTIKPDFWTDETLSECSVSARMLFIASWTFADDHGSLERSAKQLRAQAFPYDDLDCEVLIRELLAAGVLIEYEVDGKKYLHIKGFDKHQKVNRESLPKFPKYADSLRTHSLPQEDSMSAQVVLTEDSLRARPSSLEGKGRERESAPHCVPEPSPPPDGLDPEAWERWVDYRKQIRKPLKPASIPAAQKSLAAFGSDQATVVEQSIANGWQGIFAPKSAPTTPRKQEPQSATSHLPTAVF